MAHEIRRSRWHLAYARTRTSCSVRDRAPSTCDRNSEAMRLDRRSCAAICLTWTNRALFLSCWVGCYPSSSSSKTWELRLLTDSCFLIGGTDRSRTPNGCSRLSVGWSDPSCTFSVGQKRFYFFGTVTRGLSGWDWASLLVYHILVLDVLGESIVVGVEFIEHPLFFIQFPLELDVVILAHVSGGEA